MRSTFQPSVTVAAVVYADGSYLIVEEDTPEGVRYNQPAGHLESGESLIEAAVRETREETTRLFTPGGLLGVYLARSRSSFTGADVTYLRFAFLGTVGSPIPGCTLDTDILRALWLSADELRELQPQHRSPLVMQCVADHASGRSALPLSALHTDRSALASVSGVHG